MTTFHCRFSEETETTTQLLLTALKIQWRQDLFGLYRSPGKTALL